MAQFRGTLHGQRGQASRLGSAKSGLSATINGWNCGITVHAEHVDGQDIFTVSLTGGSNARESSRVIGLYTKDDLLKKAV